MIMKQVNNNPTDNRVISLRKVLVNQPGGGSAPVILNAQQQQVMNGSTNGILTNSNGFTTNNGGIINTSIATTNGILAANRIIPNGQLLVTTTNMAPVVGSGATTTTAAATGSAPVNRICLTQQQLQKLLEQQLQQQQQPNGQPQIIRVQGPQIIRLQQPLQQPQILRFPGAQPGQIIRIPNTQLQQLQRSQHTADGKLILPQPIQITAQQLQQIQNLQQRQQQTIIQQPQTTTAAGPVQVLSLANAQTALIQQLNAQQQQQKPQLVSLNPPTVVAATTNNGFQSIAPAIKNSATIIPTSAVTSAGQFQSMQNVIPFSQAQLAPAVKRSSSEVDVKDSFVTQLGTMAQTPQLPAVTSPFINNSLNNFTLGVNQNINNGVGNNGVATSSCEGAGNTLLSNGSNNVSTNGNGASELHSSTVKTEAPAQEDDDDITEIGEVIRNPPAAVNGNDNGLSNETKKEEVDETEEKSDQGVIDIVINNVVCSYSIGCHVELREIAMTGNNVEYKRENGMVTMKLRRPPTTASIWSSGKITCTGSTSEQQAHVAARRVARCLQKLGCNARFRNFRVVNVLGTCTMPFAIKITPFSVKHRDRASYEPELHPGVTFRIAEPKATLKIFSTGSITVTAPSVANVQSAIEHIYPLVSEFSKERTVDEDTRRYSSHFVHYHHSYDYASNNGRKKKKFKMAPPEDEEDFFLDNPIDFMSDDNMSSEEDDDVYPLS